MKIVLAFPTICVNMKYIHLNESESEARLKNTRDKIIRDAADEILNLGMDDE